MGAPYGFCYNSTGTTCSGKCQTGTKNLATVVIPRFPPCYNLGCYNCRQVVGGSSLSTHGEGRGQDLGFPGMKHPEGTRLSRWLVEHAEYLGIQRVIWSREQWDSLNRVWRYYGGQNPHYDHVHAELCWPAATGLTKAEVELLFVSQPPVPVPIPPVPIPDEPEPIDLSVYVPIINGGYYAVCNKAA